MANKDDPNSVFVWHKKYEKEIGADVGPVVSRALAEQKRTEAINDLELVRKRRKERELEEYKKQKFKENNQKENVTYEEWKKQEDAFELYQAKERSRIRISENREQPIDVFSTFLHDEKHQLKPTDPVEMIDKLRLSDVVNLGHDIKFYINLDTEENNKFWKSLLLVVESSIKIGKSVESAQGKNKGKSKTKVMYTDIEKIVNGKTAEQLCILEESVCKKIQSRNANVDTEYWQAVLLKIKDKIARLRMTELFRCIMRERMSQNHNLNANSTVKEADLSSFEVQEVYNSRNLSEEKPPTKLEEIVPVYDDGSFSPKLVDSNSTFVKRVLTLEEFENRIIQQRNYVLHGTQTANDPKSLKLYNQEKNKKMEEDEEEFNQDYASNNSNNEARVANHYLLKKPKFFNKMITGFEWNQYNQTHYDANNPPPKKIQGYKFNIFFPDLLDPKRVPQYSLHKCEENGEYCILKIAGGPPYEDIAFKILNDDWDFGYDSTFICQFENNVFQLWFSYRKYTYRR